MILYPIDRRDETFKFLTSHGDDLFDLEREADIEPTAAWADYHAIVWIEMFMLASHHDSMVNINLA